MGFQTKLQRINKMNGENIIKLKWIFIYEVHLEKMHQNEAITIYERYNIINDTPCPKKKAFVFESPLSTSNLAQNSCSRTVLKSAGTQLSNAPPEI